MKKVKDKLCLMGLSQGKAFADEVDADQGLEQIIKSSWSKIAPFWPLKNLVAVNPLSGFEDLPFEEALRQAQAYFQQKELPEEMVLVNRESIKWLQAFFDEGQATIQMPKKELGLLGSVLSLLRFDHAFYAVHHPKWAWMQALSDRPNLLIARLLDHLHVAEEDCETFLTLMLTTLPGWAAHVQYRTHWPDAKDAVHPHPVTPSEYLAFRLVLMACICPDVNKLLDWHRRAMQRAEVSKFYKSVVSCEESYQASLVKKLTQIPRPVQSTQPDAQLVFCIDVRSEPFRRALEAQGNYETYGFAGFFGVPVAIHDDLAEESYAYCPVLLAPQHQVVEERHGAGDRYRRRHKKWSNLKKIYQSFKYSFATTFNLVEAMGVVSGLWMGCKSLMPKCSAAIQARLQKTWWPECALRPLIEAIPFDQQLNYAASALKAMGLTQKFSPLVVFCAHGSVTENNAYATALDCGACGGRHGAPNARILAAILNESQIRDALRDHHDIVIPSQTLFLAANHNTTTDQVMVYTDQAPASFSAAIAALQKDLERAGHSNSLWRSGEMRMRVGHGHWASRAVALRARDWAQVRPEWGLARNAALVIGPRWLTKNVDLEGRSFLHSYEWEQDADGSSLEGILTAPMIVAQWINAQYFFSSWDNVAFGGGSKVTKNITGKVGVMQGNASDLMHGLPLQSVHRSDDEPYHQPLRLTVFVYAPKSYISAIIEQHPILQKLFGHGWVHLFCADPVEDCSFKLTRSLRWETWN